MSKRNPGGLISTTGLREPSAIDQSQNSGVWTLDEQYQADARGTWANQSGQTYEIGNSLRFRANSSSILTRTAATSPSNNRAATLSFWLKLGMLTSLDSSYQSIIQSGVGASDNTHFFFATNNGGSLSTNLYGIGPFSTTALFRDPSAWYHIVFVWDTAQPLARERVRLYVNGLRITDFASWQDITQNTTFAITNSGQSVGIGNHTTVNRRFDGYLAEFNCIDGQTLTPDYFGYFDYNDIWQPKKYTGSYGTNGFYLPFKDNTTSYGLGKSYVNTSNLLTYSEQLENGAYSRFNTTISANATTAPDGAATADKVIDNTTNNYHTIQRSATVANGQRVTMSVYAKAAEYGVFLLNENVNCNAQSVFGVGPKGGTASTASSNNQGLYNAVSKIEDAGNGWYRCSVTFTASGFTTIAPTVYMSNSLTAYNPSFAGTGSSGMFFWGWSVHYGDADVDYRKTEASVINTDWTVSNIATTDWMKDSPTNGSTVEDTGLGGQLAGNYPTIDVLSNGATTWTISDGSLRAHNGNFGSYAYSVKSTMSVNTGKWYFETYINAVGTGNDGGVGIMDVSWNTAGASSNWTSNPTVFYYRSNGIIYQGNNGSGTTSTLQSTSITSTAGDYIGVAFDVDNKTIQFYKNGVALGTSQAFTLTTGNYVTPSLRGYYYSDWSINFGQRPFAYAAPAGYKCLTTANLPQPAIPDGKKYFDVLKWNGTTSGTDLTILGTDFTPDLLWTKTTNTGYSHYVQDSVRTIGIGNENVLSTDTTAAEADTSGLANSFIPGGFTVRTAGSTSLGNLEVTWAWKAGGTAVTNTDGNVNTTVSANRDAGFSIVTYVGNGSASLTSRGHGLGRAPKFYIIKNLGGSTNWFVYHTSLGNTGLALNSTATSFANDSYFSSYANSLNFFVSTNSMVNTNGNPYVAYVWADIPGYSSFGSYTGNGSTNGPFIYTGFRPKWILYKAASGTAYNWGIYDTRRDPFNGAVQNLAPNTTDADINYGNYMDILSNGFKCRASGNLNQNGSTYIYAAFAEHPFKTARAR